MTTEAELHADFSAIRYAQVWEDADVLLEALAIQPGDVCVSIGSAGDNALAMLAKSPAKVVALDMNPAQLACLELRVAAYRELDHGDLLELIGSRASHRRSALYRRCRGNLGGAARGFWDAHPAEVTAGIGSAGKFERYFGLFRKWVLPLIHSRATIDRLLAGGDTAARERFYETTWNNRRWRLLFRVFFSRFVMARMGRDPSFFRYVEGSVADRILPRTRHALTALNPAENPYLQWILCGRHMTALPFALCPENFESIRGNLDRLEWRCESLETYLDSAPHGGIDRFNLSDIFEYMSEGNFHVVLEKVAAAGRSGARLAYWNMLAPRHRPESMADTLQPLEALASELHARDRAFFYSAFVVEEVA